jgi:hypothetical protein
VAFKSERFAAYDAQCGEEPPTADEARLSGRETDFVDREKLVVMKDVTMNQGACLAGNGIENIVAERDGGRGGRGSKGGKGSGGGALGNGWVPKWD